MTRRIITAPPTARRRGAWILAAALVLGVLALGFVSATLRQVTSEAVMRRWLWGAVALASGGALAAGSYLAWLARRVRQVGRFPLPNQIVIRNTPVWQGRAAALRLGWLAWACAGALVGSRHRDPAADRSPAPQLERVAASPGPGVRLASSESAPPSWRRKLTASPFGSANTE